MSIWEFVFALLVGVAMLGVMLFAIAFWVGIVEVTGWRFGNPVYWFMDRACDFGRWVGHRLKRNKNNY